MAEVGTTDIDQLQLFSQVLGGSKSSRLDKRLLHEDKLVDSVSSDVGPSQLGSNFFITADVKEGVDPEKVEAIIDEELDKLIAEGPTAAELAQAKTVFRAGFIRGIERIGGFGGKADALASCTIYDGRPGLFPQVAGHHRTRPTPPSSRRSAASGSASASHTLVVEPGERTALAEEPTVKAGADGRCRRRTRSTRPKPAPSTAARACRCRRASPTSSSRRCSARRLKNGIAGVLAERHDIPGRADELRVQGRFRHRRQERRSAPRVSRWAMLDEGAGDLDSLAFGNRAESLGANLGAGASLDGSSAYLSALKENLDPSLALFADDAARAALRPEAKSTASSATWIAGIKQEKARPNGAALRVLPPLLYGAGHPYAIPFSGTGTEASIAALTRDDLRRASSTQWVRPDNATLIVVGDTTLKDIVPLLDKHFGDWKARAPRPMPWRSPRSRARRSRACS